MVIVCPGCGGCVWGMDFEFMPWDENDDVHRDFKDSTQRLNQPYNGASILVMSFESLRRTDLPSPLIWYGNPDLSTG